MNLFDSLVEQALKNKPDLATLKIVVEKELLHHDILRVLSQHNLLANLTFIGGTCLRACYGSIRLNEDLDFNGGSDFTRDSLSAMSQILIESLHDKYELLIEVSEPIKDKKKVDTWKLKVKTRPQQKDIPAQRINIDICALHSYDKRPMMLLNPYGVDMGTSGLIIQAQSREEIYADKLIAFALRPDRLKYRDLWDLIWLHQQGLKPKFELISNKLQDRKCNFNDFLNSFHEREQLLIKNENHKISSGFSKEMSRFLSATQMNTILKNENLWDFITYLIKDLSRSVYGICN